MKRTIFYKSFFIFFLCAFLCVGVYFFVRTTTNVKAVVQHTECSPFGDCRVVAGAGVNQCSPGNQSGCCSISALNDLLSNLNSMRVDIASNASVCVSTCWQVVSYTPYMWRYIDGCLGDNQGVGGDSYGFSAYNDAHISYAANITGCWGNLNFELNGSFPKAPYGNSDGIWLGRCSVGNTDFACSQWGPAYNSGTVGTYVNSNCGMVTGSLPQLFSWPITPQVAEKYTLRYTLISNTYRQGAYGKVANATFNFNSCTAANCSNTAGCTCVDANTPNVTGQQCKCVAECTTADLSNCPNGGAPSRECVDSGHYNAFHYECPAGAFVKVLDNPLPGVPTACPGPMDNNPRCVPNPNPPISNDIWATRTSFTCVPAVEDVGQTPSPVNPGLPGFDDKCVSSENDTFIKSCGGWYQRTCNRTNTAAEDYFSKCVKGYVNPNTGQPDCMDSHSVAQTCGCNNAGAKCGTMTLPGTNTEIPAAITLSMCSSCVKGGSTNPNKKGDGCGPANQPQQTGQVSCGFPQTTCIPGAMFDYCITVGGCQQDFGNPRCPYFDISPCMACGNHCTVGYTGQCTNGGTKTCIEKQAGNPIGKWGSCSGSCSPAGATAQCSDGTNQTCQPNGTWGACNQGCTPPQTDPHNVCTQAGTCISVNGCGTSTDCSACACPAGQTKPYKKCKAGDTAATGPTQVVNECGKDEVCGCAPGTTKDCVCGGTVTCKADGTWPPCPDQHSACTDTGTGLKCQCIDGPGYDACLSLGAQCACGTPGEIVNCTGGGQTSYDKNGTLGNCASHAICNPSNKSCSMTSTSGTDRCQVGIGCGCTPGKVQNCAGGGIQTCNVDGTWGSCPVVACPPTNCDCIEGTQKACPCGGLSTCHNCEYSQCPDKHTKCNTDTGKCECVNGSGAPECDTVGGTCTNCAPDQTICGTNCCNANQICDPDSGTCTSCAENQTVCGTNCCNAGQYCCAGVCSNSACNIPAVKPKIGSGLYCDAATYLGPGIGMVYFKWDYTPVAGHPQSNYRLQISTKGGANFTTGMVFDSSIVSGAGSSVMMRVKPSAVESTNNCKAAHNYDGSIGCHFINYGVSYYWRVKVTDTAGNSSGWVNYADPTNVDDQDSNPWAYKYIYAHPSPYVSYATPTNVAPGTSGTFNDFSVCYDNLGKFYSCKCHDPACVGLSPANILDSCVGGTCYSWWLKIPSGQNIPQYMSSHVADSIAFPDQSGVGPTYGPYTVPGTVGTSLQVCDDIGCCYSPQYMKIGTSGANRAPQYQEVPSL